MIDGVKIDVPNLHPNKWLDNNLLDFYTLANTTTGELKDSTQVAHYKGLTFIITASKAYLNRVYCSIRGSLHKYFNNGTSNANDFTHRELVAVIYDLFTKFGIDPDTSVLRNLEFGVNIDARIPAKALINNLVALHSDPFTEFKVNGSKIGKGIGKQRYKIKVYDKGKQENLTVQNLVRVEIAVKKMHYLNPYDIVKLGDLLQLEKVEPLGGLLVEFWNNAIYYDKGVNWKPLTDFERKKLLYYATPRNWADFTPKQRLRAKAHFHKIIGVHGLTKTHTETGNLIASKWSELTAKKCPRLNHDFKQNGSIDLSTFEPLECTVNLYPKPNQSKNKKSQSKMSKKTDPKSSTITHQKNRCCRTCKKDISHKYSNALYCSKKCNNSYQAFKRKKMRYRIADKENRQLLYILPQLLKTNLSLIAEYRHKNECYADNLLQSEINAPYYWIRKVVKVTIIQEKLIVLTGMRAKQLIKHISDLNLKK